MTAPTDRQNDLKSDRTTLQRSPHRGAYDFDTVAAILDAGIYCHVGFVSDGQPYVVPTGYGRDGHSLVIHGSVASRMVLALAAGAPACVTVTLMDGLVMARSSFHNSINYRSVIVLGVAEQVPEGEKSDALRVVTEHVMPGRWDETRAPNARELKLTTALRFSIDEASAKIRGGPPVDEEEDYALPVWAGVLPFVLTPQPPIADERLGPGIEPSKHVTDYCRPSTAGGVST